LAACAAFALATACGPGRIVHRGEVNDDAVGVVRHELPPIRGLAFTAAVPVLAMPPDQIRGLLAQELTHSFAPGDLALLQTVYLGLGLLPPGTDLGAALQRIYEEEGAGFYDPRGKRLVLATRALRTAGFWVGLLATLSGRDLVGEFLVAHELTHALQDQHYGLPTTPEPLTDAHGDQVLARHAVLEGDATLAGFAYLLQGQLAGDTVESITDRLRDLPDQLASRYPEVPELVRASLAVQYDAGTAFAGRALTDGGWAAVDRLYRDPPESIEQILHPERYYDRRDHPVTITLAGTDELETAGWRRVVEDTLGELDVRVLAGRTLAPADAARVAAGWGGDRLRALVHGDQLVLVWMTAWDAPADAGEFAAVVPAVVPAARVEQQDDRVLVLVGGGAVDLDRLAARVWRRTTTRAG